jgi:hypothetical protein
VRKSLAILEARGLVVRVGVDGRNPANDDRGVLFRVPMAAEALAPREGASRGEGASSREAPSPPAPMKEHERKHESGVYEIRTIAARLFEAHRGTPGFDHDRLRALVRDALIGQGRQPEDGAIEDAIRGMAT